MFKSIRFKILFGFTAVIVVFLLAIVGNMFFQNKVTMLTDQANRNWNKLSTVQKLTDQIRQADEAGSRYVMSNTDEDRKAYLEAYEAELPAITQTISELKTMNLSEAELAGIQSLEENWNTYLTGLKEAFALAGEGNFPEGQRIFITLSLDSVVNSQTEFQNMLTKEIASEQQEAGKHRGTAMALSLGLTGFSILLAAVIALLLASRIVKPIRAVASQLKEIAEGGADLTRRITVKSRDEAGELAGHFNKMTENLGDMIREVKESAERLASSSIQLNGDSGLTARATERIAGIISGVAEGTEQQMSSLKTNMTTLVEISDGIGQIAESVQDISGASIQSAEAASAGDASIQSAMRQMNLIHESIHSLDGRVSGFVSRSKEIASMVGAIRGIASQTQMLALNAAIEAARAGEQGRGFAVVADQVRKLAEQSDESAGLIAALAKEIQSDADEAVRVMGGSTEEVRKGVDILGKAGQSFSDIRLSVDSLAGQIQEVSAAIEEITAATDETVKSISMVTRISEETAAGTNTVSEASREQRTAIQQIASSAGALSELAAGLEVLVQRFHVGAEESSDSSQEQESVEQSGEGAGERTALSA